MQELRSGGGMGSRQHEGPLAVAARQQQVGRGRWAAGHGQQGVGSRMGKAGRVGRVGRGGWVGRSMGAKCITGRYTFSKVTL